MAIPPTEQEDRRFLPELVGILLNDPVNACGALERPSIFVGGHPVAHDVREKKRRGVECGGRAVSTAATLCVLVKLRERLCWTSSVGKRFWFRRRNGGIACFPFLVATDVHSILLGEVRNVVK